MPPHSLQILCIAAATNKPNKTNRCHASQKRKSRALLQSICIPKVSPSIQYKVPNETPKLFGHDHGQKAMPPNMFAQTTHP